MSTKLTLFDPVAQERAASETPPAHLRSDGRRRHVAATPRDPPHAPLASSTYQHDPQQVAIYPGLIAVRQRQRTRGLPVPGTGKRGRIHKFSGPSRKRLIRTMSQVDVDSLSTPLWTTLTHHHARSVATSWRQFRAFRERLRRRYPAARYVWRRAMQRRRVVHYHLVIWFPASQQGLVANPLTARTIASLWHLVSDPDSRANGEWGARVEQVESIKRIRLYVAGYLSDVRRGDDVPGGRQWGYSRALKRGPLVAHTLPSIDSEALVAALRRVLLARTTRPDWVRGYTRACSVVVVYMDWREAAELLYGELRISPSEPQPPPGGIDL